MTLETVLRNIELDDMVKVMVFHYNYNGDIFKTKLSYGKTTDTLHLLANSFCLMKLLNIIKLNYLNPIIMLI